MFYQPEIMVFMWMLPALGLIIVPALWPMFTGLYRAVERSRLADVRGFIEVSGDLPANASNAERRRDPRVCIEGPKAIVARQHNCCQSYVRNISLTGISFVNLPQKMFPEANDKFRVIFRSREQDYPMLAQPRWKKISDHGYMIGAEILSPPAGWQKFVAGFCQSAKADAA